MCMLNHSSHFQGTKFYFHIFVYLLYFAHFVKLTNKHKRIAIPIGLKLGTHNGKK